MAGEPVSKATAALVQYYESVLAEHGATPRGVDWIRADDMVLNFAMLMRVVRQQPLRGGFSLLDVGCGIGLLLDFLESQDVRDVDYVGVDASARMVEAARQRYPSRRFIHADILDDSVDIPPCDYAIANGVFTERREMSYDEMDAFMGDGIAAMYRRVRRGFAFNVLSSHVNYRNETLYYRAPGWMLDLCVARASRFVTIHHDSASYIYTTCVYRPEGQFAV